MDNFYVSLFGGGSFPQDIDGTYDPNSPSNPNYDWNQELSTGYILGGTAGAEFTDHLRGEVELSYAKNDSDNAVFSNTSTYPYSGSGDVSALYVLGNIWLDLPVSARAKLYAGGGAGIGFVNADITYVGTGPNFGPDDTDTGFAFQLGGGAQFGITQRVAFDLGYRFKGITGLEFDDRAGGATFKDIDLFTHTVTGALVIKLGSMPPAP